MVNEDRVVPVTKTDLLTLYVTIAKLANAMTTQFQGVDFGVKESDDVEGTFTVTNATLTAPVFLNQPAKKIVADDGGFAVVFVADYGFEGFFDADGNAIEYTVSGDGEIVKDAVTLYAATSTNGTSVTVMKLGA